MNKYIFRLRSIMSLSVGRADGNILHFIKEYLQSRGLLKQDFLAVQGRRKVEYWSEEQFWQDVIRSERIYATCQVKLKEFSLAQWIPRAPGQYYTLEARESRNNAEHFIKSRSRNQARNTDYIVFDPYGKSQMVKGGVGCLRLTQKQVGNETLHFLCATSSGVTHKGLVVALRQELYEKLIADIEQHGGVYCDIFGQVRYWSGEYLLPIYTPRHIPRMYVYVEKIVPLRRADSNIFDVTAAVLFRGEVDGKKGTFFVYSHFNPAKRHSLDHTIEQCVEWMEKNYVRGLYGGKILTDFDEVAPRFEDVSFPVKALMNPKTDALEVIDMCSRLYERQHFIDKDLVESFVNQVVTEKLTGTSITIVGELTMNNNEGDTYNVGQAGAVGKYARSDNNTFLQSEQKRTLADAAAEIQQLLKQLEQTNPTATEPEQVAFINDETTPSFKRRVVGALQASGETAIDEFILENKYLKVAKAAIKGWLQPGT
ncbi:MAG: hypothetical protein ACK5QJ_05285 [Microcystis sp.]|uniref:hypothetical protein n=1 Tax=Microcystis sp. TaxID=1127 RepID=UPI0022CC504A|nr:hypothetical protein [Microcystis sp. LE17-20D]MCZ8068493.1 hypothetical protein [Microcystis sp. LE17-20D]MCZ8160853.1 hypothetical protein [Microcystis sp. LE19-196.1B]